MTPYYEQDGIQIFLGDCRDVLARMPSESIQTCVTSPPYFGLRSYLPTDHTDKANEIGLEPTIEAYVAEMVAVFREVRRVLKDDGTVWLNLGDSYAAARGGTHQPAETLAGGKHGKTDDGKRVNRSRHDGYNPTRNASAIGLKHKDLIGIPWRVAFALQSDGYYLRQDIIWHKPNPMPESVTDRCTKAHEYIFLLTKNARYYYDAAAIAEVFAGVPYAGNQNGSITNGDRRDRGRKIGMTTDKRNKRSVWTVSPKHYPEAHFATFPPQLIEPCILAGSRTGDIILDPFAGSGTALQVAKCFGRRAVGIELNQDYLPMIERRLQQNVLRITGGEDD